MISSHTMRHFNPKPLLFGLSGLFLVILLVFPAVPGARAQSSPASGIQAYAQTSPGHGWLLMDGLLFRTEDNGAAWTEITPTSGAAAHIESAVFIDDAQGRVMLSGGDAGYSLARSADSGSTWEYRPLEFSELRGPASPVAALHMGWRDASLGWLVFQFATGSNFSAGMLYITEDGGETWSQRTIPLGEPAYFFDSRNGWTAGGPAGDKLYRTSDGGLTWQADQIGTGPAYYSLPRLDLKGEGLLPLVRMKNGIPVVEVYRTTNQGGDWTLLQRIALETGTPPQSDLPMALPGADQLILHIPGSTHTVSLANDHLTDREDASGLSAGIVSLSTTGMQSGWAQWAAGECSSSVLGMTCSRQEKLLATQDGGASWQPLTLPILSSTTIAGPEFTVEKGSTAEPDVQAFSPDADTQPYIGHGFDKCQMGSLSELQTWWSHSPYSAVNLYIGGSARACPNELLSASFLSQLHAQGWRFIPTWVGPQASCSGYTQKMSSNVETAYSQGISEADAALTRAISLGLTGTDKSGTVIYYDLEGYDITDSNCRAAADAFVSGWTGRMQAYNNVGAVYGASWASAPSDWTSIANIPDALWVANWYDSAGLVSFDPTATVWDAYGLANNLWSNHQRLRQYAGGHDETWGGLTLNIDSSVLDGPLTVPNGTGETAAPSQPSRLSPAEGSTWARSTDTWLFWKTTGDTCSVHIWGGTTDITRSASCSQYHLGVKAGGAYSWQVTAVNARGTTTGPVWHFKIRPRGATSLTGSAASGTRVDLSWQLSSDEPANIDGYLVYADGARVGSVGKGVSSFQVKNLACVSPHSFQVRSVRQDVQSGPSNTLSLNTSSCAPALIAPAGGSVTSSLRPSFSWGAVMDASGYQLQLSTVPDFSSHWADEIVSGTWWRPSTNMPANTIFYWRMRARGTFGDGDWTAGRSFTTANPPSVPGLVSPVGDSLISGYMPLLDWSESSVPSGATFDHYQLQVATDAGFASRVLSTNTGGGDAALSSYQVITALPSNASFYWRVRAFNTDGQYSGWSARGVFRTRILPPVLLTPANHASLTTQLPAFTWSEVAGASGYSLQVALDSTFMQRVLTATTSLPGYTPGTALPTGVTLYWRVRTNAVNGPSGWSVKRSFTIGQ